MKKLKGIVLAAILLLASIMMPFDVYADTLSTSNITYNYYLSDVVDSTSQLANKNYIYDVDFVFDKSYLGWVSVSMITSYIYATGDTRQATYTKAIYVNGNTAKTSIVISSNFTGANGSPLSSMSITINNSNVTPLADLSSLQDIIDLLQDIDDHISINILDELQDIVANTSLANTYLQTLTLLRQWHPYTESIPFLITLFRKGYQIIDNDLNNTAYTNYMDYPIFSVPSGSIIEERTMYTTSTQNEYYIVFGTSENINNVTNFNSYFDFQIVDGNFEFNTSSIIVNSGFRIIKLSIKCTSNGTFRFKAKNSTRYIMPILSVRKDQMHFSTDFALLFQFSNPLLDNIQIIANGISQSSSAASDLESSNNQMADDMDDLATIESGYNQQFNNQLQQIDFTSPLLNNADILPAANFVITIFNGLINNNPFSVLIIVVCILMIGKKVIGK